LIHDCHDELILITITFAPHISVDARYDSEILGSVLFAVPVLKGIYGEGSTIR
jgi:hypothetical protein